MRFAFFLVLLLIVAPAPAAGFLPLLVDAEIDNVVSICFDAAFFEAKPGREPVFRWQCNNPAAALRTCYGHPPLGPLTMAFFVSEKYIAIRCRSTAPVGSIPPPDRVFRDGFE